MANDKFGKASDRAAGKTGAEGEIANAIVKTEAGDPSSLLAPLDANAFAAGIKENNLEMAPQIINLNAGQMIKGILEGKGIPAEFIDATTGVVKEVDTWIIASPDGSVRVSILSSVQLDRKLPGFINQYVQIGRGADENIGQGKRMTPYLVAGAKLPGGKQRDWSGAAYQARLAAGNTDG